MADRDSDVTCWPLIFCFVLLQVGLCAFDLQKIQICYRTCFLAEIVAANSSISQGPLGKPSWHPTHLRKVKKELKHRH